MKRSLSLALPAPAAHRRGLICWALLLPFGARAQEAAVEREGCRFERNIHLGGAALQLNGTGLRSVAWFKAFVAGLYLEVRAGDAAAAAAQPGPKRLQLQMLTDAPASALAAACRKGMARNAGGPESAARLEARIAVFETTVNAVGTVRKRDVIDLDFEPGRGTAFSLNGTLRGDRIVGEDFYVALLRAFVGELPYDDRLKAGLLGRAA
jgi:hypothetical protein